MRKVLLRVIDEGFAKRSNTDGSIHVGKKCQLIKKLSKLHLRALLVGFPFSENTVRATESGAPRFFFAGSMKPSRSGRFEGLL